MIQYSYSMSFPFGHILMCMYVYHYVMYRYVMFSTIMTISLCHIILCHEPFMSCTIMSCNIMPCTFISFIIVMSCPILFSCLWWRMRLVKRQFVVITIWRVYNNPAYLVPKWSATFCQPNMKIIVWLILRYFFPRIQWTPTQKPEEWQQGRIHWLVLFWKNPVKNCITIPLQNLIL